MNLAEQLARCDREIAAIHAAAAANTERDAPAYLVVLGLTDWEREKRELLRESPAIQRLIEEVRREREEGATTSTSYDRAHNRHNRSGGYGRAHNRHNR